MPNLVNSANTPIQIGILPGIRPALFSLYEAKKIPNDSSACFVLIIIKF
ncbi:MAG: hypothetical protein ACJA0T_001106 [Colwellia sp.]|jgi:hypothetical protein|nr:hypothetical protein [Colwellia sp. BRX10-4]MBA6396405.1 hypothetical protein [Colwellia sp. BRX10-4]